MLSPDDNLRACELSRLFTCAQSLVLPRDATAAQGLAYAAIKRRENAIMLREAGPARIATCTLADQTSNALSATKARKKKAMLNKVKAARSSRT
jgi:hypothetical protein